MSEVQVIKLSEVTEVLSPSDALTAVAVAMEEFALVQALWMIHGRDRAVEMYVERGGHIRFDEEGEVVILWTAALAARASRELT